MGRLIDADVVWRKLQYRLKRYGNEHMSEKFKKMLDSIPTAYDVEKVIAELENEAYNGFDITLSKATDIVKRGGVE